jgi:arylsulfatase
MADDKMDVLMAGYLSKDAALDDYQAVLSSGALVHGAVVVTKDMKGEMSVEQTDHLVRKGAVTLGGVGLVVGLFAPPLLAATAVGAALGAGLGKLARSKAKGKIEKQAEATIPIGGAGLIVAYPRSQGDKVEAAVTRAIKKAVGEAEGAKVKALQAALADAQAKMNAPQS